MKPSDENSNSDHGWLAAIIDNLQDLKKYKMEAFSCAFTIKGRGGRGEGLHYLPLGVNEG